MYRRARLQFSDEEIAEAFAATRGLTMPSQLRRMLREQGRDLHAEFLALLPYRLPPVRIQLWSWRRVGLTVATLVGALLTARSWPASWDSRCEGREPAGRLRRAARRRCWPAAP